MHHPNLRRRRARQASPRQGLEIQDLLPRELWRLEAADLTKVLDLTDAAVLRSLGLGTADLVRDDLRLTREIGEAAHERRFQAIRSPSATGVDDVVGVLPENLAGAVLHANSFRSGDWHQTWPHSHVHVA